ncbi:FecR domain-containing protein [Sphingobacterium yanglingense]|uniref:FecR family protein n=1 Tax=Sphingobacterium yanglingense TaxID=1437280 RepID=A0A4R6WET6_9SPHI|nr:FecR domain-containing protein [Sphingobacterium yanglingense]TDQ73760.1 FecR family protein [Sphingobacterium yanglingense]
MNKEELVKYISGDLPVEQREVVEAWIRESAEHEKEYEDMKKIWEWSGASDESPEVDVDRAWADFKKLRDTQPQQTVVVKEIKRSRSWKPWTVAAAIITLLLSSAGILRWTLSTDMTLVSNDALQQAGLPDGSTVYLNKQTALDYKKGWLAKERTVVLSKGEAFFDVKRDTTQPFVIQSGNSKITVLGTSFHVRRADGETEVIVSSGSVQVDHGENSVRLKPNDRVLIQDTARTKVKVHTVEDQLYKYYIHQEFIFENTPLSRVFDVLGKAFDKKFVVVNDKDKTLRYTASFERQTLNEMLDVILKTFELKIEKKGNVYYIKG